MDENIVRIILDQIVPHPGNRKIGGFDQAKLEQLAESIKAVGVQQPAIVRPIRIIAGGPFQGEGYQLVAGERRWRASKLAGVPDLPCVVRDLDDVQVLKIMTIENLQREDVHPLDEADGYQRLIETAGYQVEQVAAELGKSVSYVYQRLKLKDLAPEARKLFVENKITAGHAVLIARLSEAQQKEIVEDHLTRGWDPEDDVVSVRELSDTIQEQLFMELSHATWPLDDAELVPAAGACRACLKRTGAQPELFADVCKETKKKDQCLDAECFQTKSAALIKRRKAELKGTKYFQACGSYTSSKPKDTANTYEWTECKKDEPKAQRVLIVAGNGAGRMTYGVDRRSASQGSSAAAQAKREAEEQREKAEEEKQKLVRRRIYDAVSKAVKEKRIGSLLQQKLLDGILGFIAGRVCQQYGYQLDDMIKAEGWGTKGNSYTSREDVILQKLKGLDAHQLLVMLLKITMSEFLDVDHYQREPIKPLEVLAGTLGVDVKEITAAAVKEIKDAKKKPAPEGKDSPGGPSPKKGKKKAGKK